MRKCEQDIVYNVQLSTPLDREVNAIGVIEGDDVFLNFDFLEFGSQFVGNGYNLTVYSKEDRTTLVSVPLNSKNVEATIDDYGYGNMKAVVVVEDRTNISDIQTIATVGYIYFKQFEGGTTGTISTGFLTYLNANGTTTAIPTSDTELLPI